MFGFNKKKLEQPRSERRESFRVQDATTVELLVDGLSVTEGRIEDVCDTGLRMSSAFWMAPGTHVTAHLPLPGRTVAVRLLVIRGTATENGYAFGMHYVHDVPGESILANYWLRLLSFDSLAA